MGEKAERTVLAIASLCGGRVENASDGVNRSDASIGGRVALLRSLGLPVFTVDFVKTDKSAHLTEVFVDALPFLVKGDFGGRYLPRRRSRIFFSRSRLAFFF